MALVALVEDPHEPLEQKVPFSRQNKYKSHSIDADIAEGIRIRTFARDRYGEEATADFIQQASGVDCGHKM